MIPGTSRAACPPACRVILIPFAPSTRADGSGVGKLITRDAWLFHHRKHPQDLIGTPPASEDTHQIVGALGRLRSLRRRPLETDTDSQYQHSLDGQTPQCQ